MKLHALTRYWRTVRHLKPAQVFWRLRYRLADRRAPKPLKVTVPASLNAAALAGLASLVMAYRRYGPPNEAEVAALRQNIFTFLNVPVRMGGTMDWQHAGASRLWLYHLHSFGYARALAMVQGPAPNANDTKRVAGWMADWIVHNPVGTRPAWDAFVVAARLLNWCEALSIFPVASETVRQSLAEQTAYLLHRIEHDVRANHLLKDAQALVTAGRVLGLEHPVGRRAATAGMRLFERELAEQVLADGGHYERSPMYHAQVLEDGLPVCAACGQPPETVRSALARMVPFLARMLHADGDIPLFGDAALRTGTSPRGLIALACDRLRLALPERPGGCYALEPSGFYVMAPPDGRVRLVAKAGPPGPAYQLGHAHADMLSYELTAGTRRIIVDSGVKEYERGPWRDYCRSTRAHNTVSVFSGDQLECWDAFRVGRRYRARLDYWGEQAPGWRLTASHDGFRPYRHARSIYFYDYRFWLILDEINGGECAATSFIHFHPEVTLEQHDAGRWYAQRDGEGITIVPFGVDTVARMRGEERPLQGWYCPEFGKALPADCLILQKLRTRLPRFGYAIFPGSSGALARHEIERFVATLTKSAS